MSGRGSDDPTVWSRPDPPGEETTRSFRRPAGSPHPPPDGAYLPPPGQYPYPYPYPQPPTAWYPPSGWYAEPPAGLPPAGSHPGYPYGYGPSPAGYRYAPGGGVNGMAVASLVLGLIGFLWVTAAMAVVFALVARSQIPARGQTGGGIAVAGFVLGLAWIVGPVIWLIAVRGWGF